MAKTKTAAGKPRDRVAKQAGSGLLQLADRVRHHQLRRRLAGRAPFILGGLGVLYAVITLAESAAAAAAAVGVILAVLALAWWTFTHQAAAVALVATLLTFALTSYTTTVMLAVAGGVRYGAGVFVLSYWALAGAAVAATWSTRRHRGSRAATVVICDLVICAASILCGYAPYPILVAAAALVAAVVFWRADGARTLRFVRARVRSRVPVHRLRPARRGDEPSQDRLLAFDPQRLAQGAAAEVRTGETLQALDESWAVLHSRSLPGTHADLDHLLIGPSGVFVLDTKDWFGRITLTPRTAPGGAHYQAYALNGSAERLAERLTTTAFEARRVALALRLPTENVHAVVVFHDRIRTPQPVISVDLHGVLDHIDQVAFQATVHLVRLEAVTDFLAGRPVVEFRRRTALIRVADRVHRRNPALTQGRINDRYRRDLAAVADYLFPPAA